MNKEIFFCNKTLAVKEEAKNLLRENLYQSNLFM